MPILNALELQNQRYLNFRSEIILNTLRICKGNYIAPFLFAIPYD